MLSAAELIEALQARHRRRFPLHAERPFGEFPPTWRAWFLSMRERAGAVVGAPVGDFVAILAARPAPPRPKAPPPLTRWQALRRLGRQQWEPASPDLHRTRRFAAVFSGVMHLVLVVLLLWLGEIQLADAPPEAATEGEATLVEFIGEGTPTDDTGGAPAQGATPGAAAAASATTAAAPTTDARSEVAQDADQPQADAPATEQASPATSARAEASTPTPAVVPTDVPTPDVPLPELRAPDLVLTPPPPEAAPPPVVVEPAPAPPAPVEQPLVVTQTPKPDNDFRVPPPSPPVPAPVVVPPKPEVREVAVTPSRPPAPEPAPRTEPAAPAAAAPKPPVPVPPTPAPPVAKPPTSPAPTPAPPKPPTPVPPVPTPPVPKPPAPPAVAPEAPKPAPKPAPPASKPPAAPAPSAPKPSAPPASPAPKPAAPTPAPTGEGPVRVAPAGPARRSPALPASPAGGVARPAAGAGHPVANAPGGVGPSPSARPGAAPATVRDDDWGASARNVPGNATAGRSEGLFDGSGRVRLPGNGGNVGGGLPPGTIVEDFEKIDRMGTWLKRPSLGYTPTRFDRFWVPHEDLLQEWVRKGIKEVIVPIPGTSKKMRCVVSLLQAAGGCTITDPNLQDQEATARPPPDVPFKPELQQDQGSLAKPAAPAPPGTP